MKLVVFSFLFFAMALRAQNSPPRSPDILFLHGEIYTGAELGLGGAAAKVYPRAQALAVAQGRVVAVGSDNAIRKLKSARTQVVDLGGRFVMPGFNDAHLHLASGGFQQMQVDLAGTRSLDEMKQRIAERAKTAAAGEWILGRGWDDTKWSTPRMPTRQDLDALTGDHPASFSRVDGHMLVANSAALKAAGITRNTPDPAHGRIDRDAGGEPTGGLREMAQDLLISKIPAPTPAQRRRAAELALASATQSGVTSAQDNSAWEDFLTYADLEDEDKLTLRITEWLPFPASLKILDQHRAFHSQQDPMLHTGMLKGFMDGSLGSHTAAMLQPYTDDPGNSGLPQYEQSQLDQLADQRAAAGYQMGFHAIGDRGVAMALQAFGEAQRYVREHNPNAPQLRQSGFRFRVEHAQVVASGQFASFRELGVIASMQPNHLLTDMNWAIERIGPERAKHSYAWAEFLRNRVVLAFGTDYPVEPLTPFRGLYAAVTRKSEDGAREYVPEQKISIDQAIAAYTTGAAYAEFAETEKGRLAPGFLADFVVLDRDITRVTPVEILHTRVLRTVVGGRTVYEAKP